MTEREICTSYRQAKRRYAQLQVLADLNCIGKTDVIMVLMRNGEEVPRRGINILNKRLRTLKAQISEMEREYMENVAKRSYERLDNLDIQIHEKEQEYQEIAEIIKQEEKQWNR